MSTTPKADMTGCTVKRTNDTKRFLTEYDADSGGIRLKPADGDGEPILLALGAFRNQIKGGEYYFPDQTEHREFMEGYETFRTNAE